MALVLCATYGTLFVFYGHFISSILVLNFCYFYFAYFSTVGNLYIKWKLFLFFVRLNLNVANVSGWFNDGI